MTDNESNKIRLSKVSRFPDIELEAITEAIELARQQVADKASYEDIVTQAIANLPDGITSFERRVVSGLVLAEMMERS